MPSTPLNYLNQFATTTLNVGGGINISQTTGIIVQSVSGLDITKAGVACLTFSDPINTAAAEWVTFTSINGSNELQGVVRGAEGFSAKTHSNGAVIAFPISESHINNLNAMFDTIGLDVAQIATPASPSAGRNKIYTKTGDKVYSLTSAGVESTIATEAYVDANAGSADGWTTSSNTWVYATASTFTIAGVDRTAIFTKGTRLKFTQTTVKYAVVLSSSFATDTTVTIAINTDHTIANAAITLPFYSYQASPQGYPVAFNVLVTNGLECRLSIVGKQATLCGWSFLLQASGGSTTVLKDITYIFTFANAPIVVAQNIGLKYTTAPTVLADLNTTVTADGLYKNFALSAITTTKFSAHSGQTGDAGADTYRGFSWIVIGTI